MPFAWRDNFLAFWDTRRNARRRGFYFGERGLADARRLRWRAAQSEGVLPNWPRNQREKSPAEEKPRSSATSYSLRLPLARDSSASSARDALMIVMTLSPSAARCRLSVR